MKPGPLSLAYARKIGEILHIDPPYEIYESDTACCQFISDNKVELADFTLVDAKPTPPTARQLEYASRVADSFGVELPNSARFSQSACAAFITNYTHYSKR